MTDFNTKINDKRLSESFRRSVYSLKAGNFRKLICGASNTDELQVERLALIYSLAGIDVIDISLDVYNSAITGINKAKEIFEKTPFFYPNFNEPLVMLSLNCGDDPHFRKVSIDISKCSGCYECLTICPSGAIQKNNNLTELNIKKCYGCGRCIKVCQNQAVAIKNTPAAKDIKFCNNIDAIEIHVGKSTLEEIREYINIHSEIIKKVNLLSFCIESRLFNADQLVDFARAVVNLVDKKVIIQIDGVPMGATNLKSSGIQTITSAALLADAGIDCYIQVSGGVNHFTQDLINLLKIKISGIGYGTFARKILLPYIEGFNEDEFLSFLPKSVYIATSLVRKL